MKTKEQHNPAQEYSLSRVLSPKAQEAILQICQTNPTNQHEQRARNYEASKMNSHIQNIIGHMALKDLNLPAQLPENPDDLDRLQGSSFHAVVSADFFAINHHHHAPGVADYWPVDNHLGQLVAGADCSSGDCAQWRGAISTVAPAGAALAGQC